MALGMGVREEGGAGEAKRGWAQKYVWFSVCVFYFEKLDRLQLDSTALTSFP